MYLSCAAGADAGGVNPDDADASREAAFELRHADLTLLRTVAEYGSLRAAARRRQLTQSTASRRLAYLERRLNARLLDRGPAGAVLTDDGWALLRAGQSLADALARAARQLADAGADAGAGAEAEAGAMAGGAGAPVVPVLRLAAAGRHWEEFADDLARWLPRVVLDLRPAATTESAGLFDRYDVDAVYGWDTPGRPFAPRRPSLRLPVAAEPLWALLPATHPGAAAGALRLADLAADAWVLPHQEGERAVVLDALRESGAHGAVTYVTDSLATLLSLVAHGHGVALAAPLTRRPAASVVRRPVAGAPTRQLFLAVDPAVVPEPLAAAIRDRLRAHYTARAARDNPQYRQSPPFPLPDAGAAGDPAGSNLVAHLTVSRTLTPQPAAQPAGLLEPEHLYLLRMVQRTGSLNRAAPLLLVTQPALTRRVHLLERAIGRTLLERTPRGTAPSAAAHRLLADTEPAEAALAALVARFRAAPRLTRTRPSRPA